jgi:hypothetical protein
VEQLVRAISIRQPYVERILNGTKKAEFRSRRTLIRERVYLYVSMRRVDPSDRSWSRLGKTPAQLDSTRGLIVGSVEIVGCEEIAPGEFAWQVKRPRRCRVPLVGRGQPQPVFWRPKAVRPVRSQSRREAPRGPAL